MTHVTKGAMEGRCLLLPPLPEQQRIVAILHEAFEGLAIAVANAEKNLKNARDLFSSSLQTAFASAAEEWPHVKLDELSEQITDGTHNSPHTS
jgi:type I restriction enzyme S subunit